MALTPAQIVATLSPIVGRAGAAGIAGNLQQESSDNPGSAGGGLAQWQGSSYTGLVKYAQSRGLPTTSAQAALGYLAQDLKGPYSGLAQQLRSAKDPGTAATLFSNIYERPGKPMLQNRINYAQQALGAGGAQAQKIPGLSPQSAQTQTTSNMQVPSFDQKGFDKAQARYVAGSFLQNSSSSPWDVGPKGADVGANPLLATGVLTTKAPQPADYMTAHTNLQSLAGTALAKHPQGTDVALANQAVKDAQATGASGAAAKMLRMVRAVVGSPYNQGNHAGAINQGEGKIRQQGTDCSGLISWLMGPQGLGIWKGALATPGIPSAPGLQAGQGQQITIWNNAQAGNAGHVFIRIGNQFFASEGGVGVHQLPASEVQAYLTHGSDGGHYQAFHPKGL